MKPTPPHRLPRMHRYLLAVVLALSGAMPAAAHHGWVWAEDVNSELAGTIVAAKLGNPHGELTLAVDGTNTYWFQTASALSLAPAPAIYTPGTAAGANTQPAGFVVDTIGCRWVTAQFKATTAPASTSMAVFYAVL